MNHSIIGKGKVVVIGSTDTRIEINELQRSSTRGQVLIALTCIICLLYTLLMVEAHTKK